MTDESIHKILTVDDEEGILKALRRLLKNLDVKVLSATNGNEALEILKKEKVPIIISDQRMPEMTGVEFLNKSIDISPDSIRILLTGYADIEATIDAINSGAIRYYINKPWDDETLLSRIRESLDYYEIKEENKRLQQLTAEQNEELQELNSKLEQKVKQQIAKINEQHEGLKKSFIDIVKTLSGIIELIYKDIGSHSQRVGMLTKKMLQGFELDQKSYQDIVVAAFLHDIGKIALPEHILRKRRKEYMASDIAEIQQHPVTGQSIVLSISGFEDIGIIIRHHQENWDGSGYPDRLRGDKIPFGSRIISIASAFEVEAFRDDYPDQEEISEATAFLVKNSGSRFDPDLVKRFIDHEIGKTFYRKESSFKILVKPQELREGMITAMDSYTEKGMFLLPKGIKITSGIINRLSKIDQVNPIRGGIWVYTTSKMERERDGAFQHIAG
ncbi:MAG: response regulator [candidate division Zixibacteria bacterium]|nr:response regulator [candidate division Zixibacteria bacterium]